MQEICNSELRSNQVIKVLSEQLGIPAHEIGLQDQIMQDLGADSLDLVELVMALEDEFMAEIDAEAESSGFESVRTVKDLLRFLQKETKIGKFDFDHIPDTGWKKIAPQPDKKVPQKQTSVAQPFARENRYMVWKLKDVEAYLSEAEIKLATEMMKKIAAGRTTAGKLNRNCVVLESDWPGYEAAWLSIEKQFKKDQS